jgi:hypothetical protein
MTPLTAVERGELAEGLLPVAAQQRHRARLAIVLAGRDLQDRRDLLAALGLDNPDQTRTDRNHKES